MIIFFHIGLTTRQSFKHIKKLSKYNCEMGGLALINAVIQRRNTKCFLEKYLTKIN
jgi:hypothetical protein